eukprot:jgi/Psemu1/303081/fgenesh1_kg.91_\
MKMTTNGDMRCHSNWNNPYHRLTSSTLVAVVIVLLYSAFLFDYANAQGTGQTYCGDEPCFIPLRSSCQDLIDNYKFQGSCCALEIIPATGGCRITVGFGNCFWYPFCGDCPVDGDLFVQDKCNIIHETDAVAKVCPKFDYDPLQIQNDPLWETSSCAPSMAPTPFGMKSDSSVIATGNRATVLAALLSVAVAAVP